MRAAAPNAAIYVVGYPNLLPLPDQITSRELKKGCSGLNGGSLSFLSNAQVAINQAIEQAAGDTGLHYVDPNSGDSSFLADPANTDASVKGSGHTLCSPASRWINGVEMNTTFSFHPNASGQAALARSVLAKIQSTHAAVSTPPTPTNLTTKSIVSNDSSYCALLTSGGVDCWGSSYFGQLGNGQNNDSAKPVAVVSTSGSGTLSGVASLTSDYYGSAGGYCALLTSGGVDCWGDGYDGQLGNGQFYTSGNQGSAIPVAVVSTSGSGTLSGVASLTSNSNGYCALLTSGGVDCWGSSYFGQLGNGQNNDSAIPVAVVSTSGSGTLSGVASLTGDDNGYGYCALLTSGGVDCWGDGYDGQLGNGQFYTSGNYASAIPVAVVSTSGSGTLSGVASLTGNGNGFNAGYCALLTSGGVDCWGYGYYGQLGNGQFYTSGDHGSAIPVAVVSTSGSGTLSGVASLTGTSYGYCALLTSGAVDCWGSSYFGQLGNGQNNDSAIPVAVVSTSGSGTLSGVASLTGNRNRYGYCALLTSGGVDCWGYGNDGQLGNGQFNTSAIPVTVVSTSGSGTLSGVKLH